MLKILRHIKPCRILDVDGVFLFLLVVSMEAKDLVVGQKVKFSDDRLWFTVQARNERFVICNAVTKNNTYHTIIDLDQGVRGDDNLVFHDGYDNREHCEARLKDFIDGEIEVSHRNRVRLTIIAVMGIDLGMGGDYGCDRSKAKS